MTKPALRVAPLIFIGLAACGDGELDGGESTVDAAPSDVDAAVPLGSDAAGATSTDATSTDSASDAGGKCVPEGARRYSPTAIEDPAPNHGNTIDGIVYPSNPPAWGPHCFAWGQYAIYRAGKPLPRCNWIHNLEHGAIVLLYNCSQGCPEIVARLERLYAELEGDPDCKPKRLILTPDPQLDTTVAAAAWGATWRSGCLDEAAVASLQAFAQMNWGTRGRSPEPAICASGSVGP